MDKLIDTGTGYACNLLNGIGAKDFYIQYCSEWTPAHSRYVAGSIFWGISAFFAFCLIGVIYKNLTQNK